VTARHAVGRNVAGSRLPWSIVPAAPFQSLRSGERLRFVHGFHIGVVLLSSTTDSIKAWFNRR